MVYYALAKPQTDALQAANNNGKTATPTDLEARRREISDLIEEIRSQAPTPNDIIMAVERASDGMLSGDHLQRIAAGIHSLYKVR
jgi:hypothetical protein